jgi:16S rRNA processing protein RimM
MTGEQELIAIARVRRPHGLRGELLVDALTDEPDAVFAPGRRVFAGSEDGVLARGISESEIIQGREVPDGFYIVLAGVEDRTAADRWRGKYLLAPRSELRELRDDEVYVHDLVGMRVVDLNGVELGDVTAVLELPQGYLLEVRGTEKGEVLIPYNPARVDRVDRENRTIIVQPVDEEETTG